MKHQDESQEVTITREEQLDAIELLEGRLKAIEAHERISKTKDWKVLIEDMYLTDEAIRTTYLLDSPAMRTQESQDSLMRSLYGISAFRNFCINLKQRKFETQERLEAYKNAEVR